MRFDRWTLATLAMLALAWDAAADDASSTAPEDEAAAAPTLRFPLDCTLGEDCWIAQYPDAQPGPEAVDHACGARSYPGHTGVDLAVEDLIAVIEGVAVMAAADGTVISIDEGRADVLALTPAERAAVADAPCGNGVEIRHAGGWRTRYCHLRLGSIAVSPGEAVRAGDAIGLVGLSGETEFPHLHFEVRRESGPIDPFSGRPVESGCDDAQAVASAAGPLWDGDASGLDYAPGVISRVGFSASAPSVAAAVAGDYRAPALTAASPAIVGWAEVYGSAAGDLLVIRVLGPGEAVLAEKLDLAPDDGVRRFAFAGRHRPDEGWPEGTYRVETTLLRGGGPISVRSAEAEIVE